MRMSGKRTCTYLYINLTRDNAGRRLCDSTKFMISLLDRVENTGKRRKCCLPAFSPFLAVFSKAVFFSVVNSGNCVEKS